MPRIAAWRPNLGCAQLPIDADTKAVAALPRFDTRAPDLDRKPWPLGEGGATTAVVVLQDGKIVDHQNVEPPPPPPEPAPGDAPGIRTSTTTAAWSDGPASIT